MHGCADSALGPDCGTRSALDDEEVGGEGGAAKPALVGGVEAEAPPPLSEELGPAQEVAPQEKAAKERRMEVYYEYVDRLTRQGQV